jgi:hypothetical protein
MSHAMPPPPRHPSPLHDTQWRGTAGGRAAQTKKKKKRPATSHSCTPTTCHRGHSHHGGHFLGLQERVRLIPSFAAPLPHRFIDRCHVLQQSVESNHVRVVVATPARLHVHVVVSGARAPTDRAPSGVVASLDTPLGGRSCRLSPYYRGLPPYVGPIEPQGGWDSAKEEAEKKGKKGGREGAKHRKLWSRRPDKARATNRSDCNAATSG